MQININTIEDAKEFVSICSKYHDADIMVKQNRYVVDGKSILGIFSLNLLEPIKVIIDSGDDNSKIDFYNNIKKWEKENYERITG